MNVFMRAILAIGMSGCVHCAIAQSSFAPSIPQPASLGTYGNMNVGTPQMQPSVPSFPTYSSDAVRRQNQQIMDEVEIYNNQQRLQKQAEWEQALQQDLETAFPEVFRERATQLGKNCYSRAFARLQRMLQGKTPLLVKQAVYITENAFLNNNLDSAFYHARIQEIAKICRKRSAEYQTKLSASQAAHLAIFQTLYDTTNQNVQLGLPIRYDFEDYRGDSDFQQQFVSKLLRTGKGQCRSMPLLYKILADEVGAEAYWSFAPNHSFIQHRDDKGNWQYLELTTGSYVSEVAMMRANYVKAAALKNRIYMDTLSLRQTVAHLLVDLAHGYQWRFGADDFVIRCCEESLKHYPHNVSALMTMANAYQVKLRKEAQRLNVNTMEEAAAHPHLTAWLQERNRLYRTIQELGYVPMPRHEYEAWLKSLQTEKQRQQILNTTPSR